MKSHRAWWISIALLGCLVLNEYHSQREQLAALQGDLAGLHAQQARLASAVARPPVVVRTQSGAAEGAAMPQPAPAAPPASSDPPHDLATSNQRWEEDARASQAAVEDSFAAEPTNPAWAASTRLALQDRLAALARPLASSLREIDCRASICRVEVVHRDADTSRQFAEKAFTDPEDQAWNGPALLLPPQPDPDGRLAVVMYLGREGTSLLR